MMALKIRHIQMLLLPQQQIELVLPFVSSGVGAVISTKTLSNRQQGTDSSLKQQILQCFKQLQII